MSITIRNLADDDLVKADTLLSAAFQSPVSRIQDLHFYRQIEPDGWFVALLEGNLVGMVGAVNYRVFAHVGLMAVNPSAQRKGIGLTLMQFLLTKLDQQVPMIFLDASEVGRPLYNRLGFVAFDGSVTYRQRRSFTNEVCTSNIQAIANRDLDEIVKWDQGIFGANRKKVFQALLDMYPQRAFLQRDTDGQLSGYIFAQKNRIGPWVMLQRCNAGELLLTALALPYEGTISIVVPAVNQEAVILLQQYGFEQVRNNQRMGRHTENIPGQRELIYAQTSLAVG
jgi:ribosomal protein S18 acetylase RimI-like enzyme